MRTKLFLAFILIISLALLSNIVFERLIIGDFNDFVRGTEEDHIYWVMASVEGSYSHGRWDRIALSDALHWALMLGLDVYVEDESGRKILSSRDVYSEMNQNMLNRMNSMLKLPSGEGEYNWYPLYVKGEEIGKLYVKPLERLGLTPLREEVFRKRGREFLFISFMIAGGGALLLSVLFMIFLSNPLRRLTDSAEKIARGDFSIHVPKPHRKTKDEIDKLTATFNYMAEALKREDAVRKHLTSNIAHELRTPLTVIKGNLEAIEDGVISDRERVMKNITLEIDRIISLVEGIEDITQAEASFFKRGAHEEINLKHYIESIAEGMKKIIADKGLSLDLRGPSMRIRTYPDKLHIILKNLVSNSLKFTSSGGITVTWGKTDDRPEKGFYILVEDTGKGLSEEEIPRIFERFYKDEKSTGKGLGLAIVRELTEVIGGEVSVQSSTGKGSKFKLIFSEGAL